MMKSSSKHLIGPSKIFQALCSAIIEITEQKLTVDILIPLFKELGFPKVDYHGGQYEGGKDLIFWRKDEIGFEELAVAQVKKLRPKAAASNSNSFGEVVTQLQQAAEKKVPNTDGQTYLPSIIYFITPYQIDTRSLQSRFEGYSSLRPRRVKIVDGPHLVHLIMDKIPMLARKLIGDVVAIEDITASNLTNTDLMSALNLESDRDLSSFYCDLDFGVGKITTKFFFSLEFKPIKKHFSISPDLWEKSRDLYQFTENCFGVKIVSSSFKRIEQNFIKKIDHNKKINERIHDIKRFLEKLVKEINKIELNVENIVLSYSKQKKKSKEKYLNSLIKAYKTLLSEMKIYRKTLEYRRGPTKAFLKEKASELSIILDDVNLLEKKFDQKSESINFVQSYIDLIEKVRSFKIEKKTLDEKFKQPQYSVNLDGSELAAKLREKQAWVKGKIETFNSQKIRLADLKKFLIECKDLFNASELILSDKIISEIVRLSSNQKYRKLKNIGRLNLSIHDVFDTGLNILLLGDAGAGKTTTLQMYAKDRLEDSKDSGVIFFIPLARAFSSYDPSRYDKQFFEPIDILEDQIALYFMDFGSGMTKQDIVSMFKSDKVIFLLDGIDEIIGKVPWIIKAVNNLMERYEEAQIILSSRMSGEYIRELPFLGITLLPFTNNQRKKFIRGWFKDKKEEKITRLLNHLNEYPDVAQIVRNPLLATILCVLAERDVPLPGSEIRMYDERLKLLFGHYDIHKKAVRLKSQHHELELVSRKIAYSLHKSGLRNTKIEDLVVRAENELLSKMKGEKISLTVNELFDPCNVLVPMTDDGQVGFGHLRYQEYLVACEFISNRDISIDRQLYNSWWRGALVLFSQMADSIEFVFDWLIVSGNFAGASENIQAMLEVRPKEERIELGYILKRNVEMDYIHDALTIFE